MSDRHTTKGFARQLELHARQGQLTYRGEREVALFLSWWLQLHVKYTHASVGVEMYLHKYLVEAWEYFRTGQDSVTAALRRQYLTARFGIPITTINHATAEQYIEDLCSPQTDRIDRTTTIHMLSELCAKVSGLIGVKERLESFFRAQDQYITQTFYEFIRRVYRTGLNAIHANFHGYSMSGVFGTTRLEGVCSGGKIVFNFSRAYPHEQSGISFVGSEGDMTGLHFGLLAMRGDTPTAVSLITDVINNWPTSHTQQRKMYTSSDHRLSNRT